MKAIIIGASLSGKTTLIRYLRTNNNLIISEIDEELTRLNHGTYPSDDEYKNTVLTPQVIKEILSKNVIFFTNTNYFTVDDLNNAKAMGFKIIQLDLNISLLKDRNKKRVKNEGYGDLSEYLEGMVEYQKEMQAKGLFDVVINMDKPVEQIATELIDALR